MSKTINLVTEVPGPKSRAIVARREAAVPNGLYKAHPIAIDHAHGATVTDVDGNTYLDFVVIPPSPYRLGGATVFDADNPWRLLELLG